MTRPVRTVVTGRAGAAAPGGGGGGAWPDSVVSDVTKTAPAASLLMPVLDTARHFNGPLAGFPDFLKRFFNCRLGGVDLPSDWPLLTAIDSFEVRSTHSTTLRHGFE